MRLPIDLSIVVLTILAVFGLQRIISWEAPLSLSSFAFPVLAGWLISVFHHD